MTPSARAQAAIEILDEVIAAARDAGAAADTLIARYFKTRRYAGSGDRRAVRELVYAAIRRAGERPVHGFAALLGVAQGDAALRDLFDGSKHGPPLILDTDRPAQGGVAPGWLAKRLAASLDARELPALLERAPLDVRANRLKTTREALVPALPDAQPTPFAPDGLRLADNIQVEGLAEFHQGLFEVQDEGSQLAALACHAAPGMTVIDFCAGAGGKTLALAAAMAGEGRLIACDTDRGRLQRLPPRAARAGARVEERLLDPGKEASLLGDLDGLGDVVLVDAPCSGTGTWRRNPEARWRLSPDRLDRLVALQARLLDIAAVLVKPGGVLVYVVCSLLDEEGSNQVAAFLGRSPQWRAEELRIGAGRSHGPGRRLTPASDKTDGFFIARIGRPC